MPTLSLRSMPRLAAAMVLLLPLSAQTIATVNSRGQLIAPTGIAYDSANDVTYVSDSVTHTIWRLDRDRNLTVYAGTGESGFSGDGGPASQAKLNEPVALALDARGNLFVADRSNFRIRRIGSDGIIATVAGSGDFGYAGDGGPATLARFAFPSGVAVDSKGNLFISDSDNARVRRVDPRGIITTYAGTGVAGPQGGSSGVTLQIHGDGGPAVESQLNVPLGLAVDSEDSLYIADSGNFRIRVITPDGNIFTRGRTNGPPIAVAVTAPSEAYAAATFGTGPGPGSTSLIRVANNSFVLQNIGLVRGVVLGRNGKLLLARTTALSVDEWDPARPSERPVVLAGSGSTTGPDSGPLSEARFQSPNGIAVAADGTLYVADAGNLRFRQVSPQGEVSPYVTAGTVASLIATGPRGLVATIIGSSLPWRINVTGPAGAPPRLGPSTLTTRDTIRGLAFDRDGILYFTDASSVRRWNPESPADSVLASGLIQPRGLVVGASGEIYVADTNNHRIRRISPNGVVTTVAGTGHAGWSGDRGPATDARLTFPSHLALDSVGNLYVSDSGNHVIRRIDLSGRISTIAGNGLPGFSGDGGPADKSQINDPQGLAFNLAGELLFADSGNHVLRKIAFAAPATDNLTATPASLSFSSATASLRNINLTSSLPRPFTVETEGDFLVVSPRSGSTPAVLTVTANAPTSGTARGAIRVTSPGIDPLRIPVDVTAPERPTLLLSSTRFTFSGTGGSQNLELNSSAAPIPFTIRPPDPNLITMSPLSGTTPATIVITRRYPDVQLPPNFTSFAYVTAPSATNTSTQIAIALTQSASRPNLSLSTTSLQFTGEGTSIVRAESSGQPLSLSLATSDPWLTARLSNSTTPATISIAAIPTGLPPGTYTGTVTITASEAANSPQRITVTLQVPTTAPTNSLVVGQETLTFSHQTNAPAPPAPRDLIVSATAGDLPFQLNVSVRTPNGGTWLRAAATRDAAPTTVRVSINPATLEPGTYDGSVTLTAPGANSISVPVRLTVVDPTPAAVIADPQLLTFSALQDSANLEARQLRVTNPSRSPLSVRIETATESGGNWLRASLNQTDIDATNPALLLVDADPAGLLSGTYRGVVRVTGPQSGQSSEVPVVLTVSRSSRRLRLSETALSFTVVAGSATLTDLPQQFFVINTGSGPMQWTAEVRYPSATPQWLQLNATEGTSTAGSPNIPAILAQVNAAGLPPGNHQAEILIRAADSDNSPTTVPVTLRVLPPNSFLGPGLLPTGIIMTTTAGAPNPPEQPVTIFNRGTSGSAQTAPLTIDGAPWLQREPATLSFSGSTTQTLRIRANTQSLNPGIYEGRVLVSFPGGVNRTINVLLIVAASPFSTNSDPKGPVRAAAGCIPTRYLPLVTSLEDQFIVSGGVPASTQMIVVDNCGNPASKAAVGAAFSNRDRALTFTPGQDGRFGATWLPANTAESAVTIEVAAADPANRNEVGVTPLVGFVRDSINVPILSQTRPILNGASLRYEGVVAPNLVIEIQGERLATTTQTADGNTAPSSLAGTSVSLGELPLAIRRVSPTSITAVVPPNLPVNGTQQLIVRRAGAVSFPEEVAIADVAPGIFSQPDQPGRARAFVGQRLITPATPAQPGETVILECTGLGVTSSPAIQVSVGSINLSAQLAAPSPTPGVSRVTFSLPPSVARGDDVPVVLRIAGSSSASALLSIR